MAVADGSAGGAPGPPTTPDRWRDRAYPGAHRTVQKPIHAKPTENPDEPDGERCRDG